MPFLYHSGPGLNFNLDVILENIKFNYALQITVSLRILHCMSQTNQIYQNKNNIKYRTILFNEQKDQTKKTIKEGKSNQYSLCAILCLTKYNPSPI